MASDAHARFLQSMATANRLLAADDGQSKSKGRTDFYHASWAAYVAAWDSYAKSVCREYITKANVALTLGIANTGVIAYQSIHKIAIDLFESKLRAFNTPNFENSREFILTSTGYDPYADWRWDRKSLTNIQVKDLLNESVRVRHAFAHGFPVRNIVHLSFLDGKNSVTYRKSIFVRQLVSHLAALTDEKLDTRLNQLYGRQF